MQPTLLILPDEVQFFFDDDDRGFANSDQSTSSSLGVQEHGTPLTTRTPRQIRQSDEEDEPAFKTAYGGGLQEATIPQRSCRLAFLENMTNLVEQEMGEVSSAIHIKVSSSERILSRTRPVPKLELELMSARAKLNDATAALAVQTERT